MCFFPVHTLSYDEGSWAITEAHSYENGKIEQSNLKINLKKGIGIVNEITIMETLFVFLNVQL